MRRAQALFAPATPGSQCRRRCPCTRLLHRTHHTALNNTASVLPPRTVDNNSSSSSSPSAHGVLPAEASRALAALRCLPVLVGSFAATASARREAAEPPLRAIEALLAACSAALNGTEAGSENPTPSAVAQCTGTPAADPGSGSGRKRRKPGKGKSGGGAAAASAAGTAVEGSSGGSSDGGGGGGGDQAGREGRGDEVKVLRAYALEAGVGLCCLLPGGDEGAARKETLERLVGWHGRWEMGLSEHE